MAPSWPGICFQNLFPSSVNGLHAKSVAQLNPSMFIFYVYLKGGIEQQIFALVPWISCFFSVNFPSLLIHFSEFVCVGRERNISLRLTEEVLVVQPSLFAVRTGVALNPLEFSRSEMDVCRFTRFDCLFSRSPNFFSCGVVIAQWRFRGCACVMWFLLPISTAVSIQTAVGSCRLRSCASVL